MADEGTSWDGVGSAEGSHPLGDDHLKGFK